MNLKVWVADILIADGAMQARYHRYDENGERLPPGFSGYFARRIDVPALFDYIRTRAEQIVRRWESEHWEEFGVSGVEVVSVSLMHKEEQDRYDFAIQYHRLDSDGNVIPHMHGDVTIDSFTDYIRINNRVYVRDAERCEWMRQEVQLALDKITEVLKGEINK